MPSQPDEELIRRTLAGEQQAFEQLVERYQRRVAVTIRSVVGDLPQEDLADIAQDVFLLIYKALPSFRGDSQFATYLTRITLRHCYRESKRRRKRRFLFLAPSERHEEGRESLEERLAGSSRADRSLLEGERGAALIDALESLPEEFRTVLVLRIVEELSVEEVAEALEISAGTVKSRLYRAREKMRELLMAADPDIQFDMLEE